MTPVELQRLRDELQMRVALVAMTKVRRIVDEWRQQPDSSYMDLLEQLDRVFEAVDASAGFWAHHALATEEGP